MTQNTSAKMVKRNMDRFSSKVPEELMYTMLKTRVRSASGQSVEPGTGKILMQLLVSLGLR
jgi:hypothetical protein